MSKQEIFDKFIEIMGEFAQIKAVAALRDGFIMTTPFTICGSVFLLLANLPIPGYPEFMASMFGKVITHEHTLPNGTKEGKPVFMVRHKDHKLTMELGDWLVDENEEFKVLKPEEFVAIYAHLV